MTRVGLKFAVVGFVGFAIYEFCAGANAEDAKPNEGAWHYNTLKDEFSGQKTILAFISSTGISDGYQVGDFGIFCEPKPNATDPANRQFFRVRLASAVAIKPVFPVGDNIKYKFDEADPQSGKWSFDETQVEDANPTDAVHFIKEAMISKRLVVRVASPSYEDLTFKFELDGISSIYEKIKADCN